MNNKENKCNVCSTSDDANSYTIIIKDNEKEVNTITVCEDCLQALENLYEEYRASMCK